MARPTRWAVPTAMSSTRSPSAAARTSSRRWAGCRSMITLPWPRPPRHRARSSTASPRPGLHLIAEIKRSSPSAGTIAPTDDDIVARARAYEAGGASAISVLCEPHWFGGSIDDLRAVRAAVSIPVLAKEFVVEEIQLPHLRAAGADLVLLLAVLHPAAQLRALVERALEIGLEPLVEVHDESELDAALGTPARLIGINNRDLRTLAVDTDRAIRLRSLVPDDRLAVAESGVRDAATSRPGGRSASMPRSSARRSSAPANPAAAARTVRRGRRASRTIRPIARRASEIVKVCGITDADGDPCRRPQRRRRDRAQPRPGHPSRAQPRGGGCPRPRRPLPGHGSAEDRGDHRRRRAGADCRDRRRARPGRRPVLGRRAGRRCRRRRSSGLEGPPPGAGRRRAAPSSGGPTLFRDAGADRILLDAAGGPHPGGTGTRIATELARAVAREVPVILAGGLDPANVGERPPRHSRRSVSTARRGTERPRVAGRAPDEGPAPRRPVRQARPRRPSRPAQPGRPPDAGPDRAS